MEPYATRIRTPRISWFTGPEAPQVTRCRHQQQREHRIDVRALPLIKRTSPPRSPRDRDPCTRPSRTTFLGAWTLKVGLGFGIDSRLSTGREWAGVEELSTFHPMKWCKPSSFFPFLFLPHQPLALGPVLLSSLSLTNQSR